LIDTCTPSPLLREANNCSGTFSSTVSPLCMCSLTVAHIGFQGLT
jgi:hypothetical protein